MVVGRGYEPSYPNWQRKRIQNPYSVSSNLTEGTENSRSDRVAVGRNSFEGSNRPQSVRSSFRGHVKGVRDPAQIVGEQVPVAVQGQRRRLVPEKCLQNLHVGAGGDGQTCAGVT